MGKTVRALLVGFVLAGGMLKTADAQLQCVERPIGSADLVLVAENTKVGLSFAHTVIGSSAGLKVVRAPVKLTPRNTGLDAASPNLCTLADAYIAGLNDATTIGFSNPKTIAGTKAAENNHAQDYVGALATMVPKPGRYALLLAGLAVVSMMIHRRTGARK